MRPVLVAASICGLLLTALGAMGAHLVASGALPAERWNGAMLYGFVHTLAAIVAACAPLNGGMAGRLKLISGWCFFAGVALFSGVQIARMLWIGLQETATTPFDALSPLVPAGGLSFMAGWISLGAAALVSKRGSVSKRG